jgi:hypothetical protein
MKRYLLPAVLFYSIFLLCCGTEQKTVQRVYTAQERCDTPVWNVGDYWKFQLNDLRWWSYKVVRVEDNLYVLENPNDKYLYGFDAKSLQFKGYIDSTGKKTIPRIPSAMFYDFPLYAGKKWSKIFQGELVGHMLQDYLYTFKVISFENVIVRAGALDAFKIELEQNMIGGGNAAIFHVWYSPEVKNIIKYKFVTSYGTWRITAQDYELVTYKLASGHL